MKVQFVPWFLRRLVLESYGLTEKGVRSMASTVENIIKMIRILQNEDFVSGQDLAYRLGVSVKTIQKYKQDLDQMHIFIETKKGRYGGYYLDRSVLEIHSALSDEELRALVRAKTYIQNDLNFPRPLEVISAIDKVIQNERQVASARKKVNLANHVGKGYSGGFERIKLDKLQAAIQDQRMVYIEYESQPLDITERIIHPYGMVCISGQYMVIAFCELRDAVISFNVEKIRHVALTQYQYTPPKDNGVQWGTFMKMDGQKSK